MAQFPGATLNVVPSGYKWSVEAANKAAANGYYMRVGGDKGVTKRLLSGAAKSWAKGDPQESESVFLPAYRITGTPAAVRQALAYAGRPEAEIAQALAGAITKFNYQSTMKAQYDTEVNGTKAGTKAAAPKAAHFSFAEIVVLADSLKDVQVGRKEGKAPAAAGGAKGKSAAAGLADRIAKAAAAGKVLDVSTMDALGHGAKLVAKPTTERTHKVGTVRLAIISNNIDTYIQAIRLAYGEGGLTTYAEDIAAVRARLSGAGAAPVATAVVPRATSPTRTVGTIAIPTLAALGRAGQ